MREKDKTICRTALAILLVFAVMVVLAIAPGCGKGGDRNETADQVEMDATKTGEDGSTGQEVTFQFACVDDIDYMKANDLSNYVMNLQEGQPVDPAMQAVTDGTTFGNKVSLLTESGDDFDASYTFLPQSTGKQSSEGVTTFSFEPSSLPAKAGIPYVNVKGVITPVETSLQRGDGTKLTSDQLAKYTAATSFWPASDETVRHIADEANGDASGDTETVEALWKWVGENIKYQGPLGTRYGALQVLQQGYGRCWDKADAFVTLARAMGVPTREVAGWLNTPQGGGHVWAQAYISGEGWVDVDCTSDRIGADSTYLPFFATVDGAMPILYIKMPTFEE